MNRYLAEAIATFFLIVIGTGSMVLASDFGTVSHLGVSVAWGGVVTAMILIFGKSSGAHMNPAVTLTFVLLKFLPKKELVPYLLAQTVGGICGSLFLKVLFPANELLGASLPQTTVSASFWLELGMTFALLAVILISAKSLHLKFGLPALFIGLTIGLEAYFGGPVSNASMNPIRSFAPALVSGHTEHLWLYLIATPIGAILAGFCWRTLRPSHENG